MPALPFLEARSIVLGEVRAARTLRPIESIALDDSPGRILAEDIPADRDYPPFPRALRDGFAVRTSDLSGALPGPLRVTAEIRAGDHFTGSLSPGEAIEIMTGAAVPPGADAVVMVEHVERHPDGAISTNHSDAYPATPGLHIAPQGSEAREGDIILQRGTRIDYSSIAWLASTGHPRVSVYTRPQVAILTTGDELVPLDATPAPHQIRNSNAHSLAAQVARAGAIPVVLPIAPDDRDQTRDLIRDALSRCDLLLLSGGVSAGKYDFVEDALRDLDAHFFFDRVLIQPGQPLVFGNIGSKFFFGLPGNPVSTMVTFELFARAAIDLLSGASDAPLPLTLARLSTPLKHKPGLTRFLPAFTCCTEATPVAWQSSGDIPALTRANAFLVADAAHSDYAAGDLIPVLLK